MVRTTACTVMGVFNTRGHAERAIDSLRHAGFSAEQIGVAAPGENLHQDESPTAKLEKTAEKGAVSGVVTGTFVGALAGTAIVTGLIPGIGPVIAVGILAGIVGGAAAGAALGGFAGPFVLLGLSEENAHRYGQELRQGRTLVAVQADDRWAEAAEILERLGGKEVYPPCNPRDPSTSGLGP
jgi:hypothetical protein